LTKNADVRKNSIIFISKNNLRGKNRETNVHKKAREQ